MKIKINTTTTSPETEPSININSAINDIVAISQARKRLGPDASTYDEFHEACSIGSSKREHTNGSPRETEADQMAPRIPVAANPPLTVMARHSNALLVQRINLGSRLGEKEISALRMKNCENEMSPMSLDFAHNLALDVGDFSSMMASIAISEAMRGEHSQSSLNAALEQCIALIPSTNGQIRLQALHAYMEVEEPFSTCSKSLSVPPSLLVGREHSPSDSSDDVMVDIFAAVEIAMGLNTPRAIEVQDYFGYRGISFFYDSEASI